MSLVDNEAAELVTVDPDQPSIANSLIPRTDALSDFRKKNSPDEFVGVHRADVAEYIDKGWEVARRGKRIHRLKRLKTHASALEDRAWCLLYRMGYKFISSERGVVKFVRANGSIGTKQIDALGADDETCIVIECKSREERGRRSLRLEIQETASLQNYIRQSIHRQFSRRPKLVWLYITRNIIWNEQDVARANDAGIYVVTDNELKYFETFISHLGSAGKYQVLGEFLSNQKISLTPSPSIPAIRGKLGGETFYSFVTTPKDLLRISFINHQALNHPDGTPAYQRMISSKRIKEINGFIKGGGFFPTNILINFNVTPKFSLLSDKGNSDSGVRFGWLTLPNVYRSAWIIDGQHRLYGYSDLDEGCLSQSIPVIAFEGMAKVKEADLFISINHKQKSVPKGLLVALLADLKLGDSDPKVAMSAVASAVIRVINADKSSPFFLRFRMPDVPPLQHQNLTISEVVNGINRAGLIGKSLGKGVVRGPFAAETDETTIGRVRKILNGYFEAVRAANPERWEAGAQAYICVNPGIRAHLMLMPEIISYASHKRGLDFALMSEDKIVDALLEVAKPALEFIRSATDDQTKSAFSRKFGEGGVKDYLYFLCELIFKVTPDFGSEEFRRAIAQKSSDVIAEANKDIMSISEELTDVVIKTLKQVHGTQTLDSGDSAYWEVGIAKAAMKDKAHKRQQEEPLERRKRKEAYLDLIDLKDIVEQSNNWPHFQTILSLASPGEGKSGKHTKWIATFNDVRKTPPTKTPSALTRTRISSFLIGYDPRLDHAFVPPWPRYDSAFFKVGRR